MKLMSMALAALALAGGTAFAQDFPNKPVTIIVPYSGGGSTDLVGRQLAHELQQIWGQPVIAENRTGAGSMIGTAHVAQSAPDGYTLLVNTPAVATAPAVQKDLPFDPKADITPIGMVATSPYMAVAGAAVQSTNFKDFITEAKDRRMFFATAGVGTSSHFTEELLIQQAGIEADIVHFSSGGDAQVNLMGGHADVYISNTASVMPYVNNGQVKALVVLGSERYDLLPDVEASAEAGVAGIDVNSWVGLFGPGGMDPALVDKINADLHTALASESFQKVLSDNFVLAGKDNATEFKAQVEAEMDLWKALAEERNIVAE
ncbi:tripartite tricarboxylate transporter substrate-binding protein [Phaeovulum sp. NW3]|uniref:Bug family tripartite tricarboxylate transporter substrate binding protein n=1 Tax=Phaeovulum sp. NW3 TaxID=2934933 RepID=UPI0020206AAB|nr:tripartite tricarboxylate transporter substrate-binding protein [Phaeovulum sp. NW3]MCL7466524.1 tripartite tricarboxylate transporter substrate-binding protein [Phaeovulum sp. NW3]